MFHIYCLQQCILFHLICILHFLLHLSLVLNQLYKDLKDIEENHPIKRSYKNNNLFDVVETRGEKGDALYEDVMTKIDRRTRQINAELSQ